MNETLYPWKRYLCPVGHNYDRTEDGYLVLPTQGAASFWSSNNHLRDIDSLADQHCVIILGEAGIGKTTFLREAGQQLAQIHGVDRVIEEHLTNFTSASELQSELFDAPEIIAWSSGTGPLFVLLDGLDEIPANRSTAIVQALLRRLKRFSEAERDRLHLYLTCRPTAWDEEFQAQLKSLWADEFVSCYTLTVLCRQDVTTAATASSVDPDDFIQQLSESEAHALAAVPTTLQLLLDAYERDASLPSSRVELYEIGSRHLSERFQRRPRDRAETTPNKRFEIAKRLAAITLLTGKDRIDATSHRSTAATIHLSIDDALGFWEIADGRRFEVSNTHLLETLSTGLFSTIDDKYVWLHRSFQEYLAAAYLADTNLSSDAALELVTIPGPVGSQVAPQLRGLSGWLASLDDDVKEALIDTEPLLLLGSDAATLADDDRGQIVNWLIDSAENDTHEQKPGEQQLYRKLVHKDLID